MSKMDYYSNELEDDFVEIDDTISSEEYYASKPKEEKDFSYDWTHSATVTSPMYYNPQWMPNQSNYANTRQCILDAQQYNGYQDLSKLINSCQIQNNIKTTPDQIIQSYYNLGDDLKNTINNLCRLLGE